MKNQLAYQGAWSLTQDNPIQKKNEVTHEWVRIVK